MIDNDGYRANVGIILCNKERRVFWAKRCGQNAWQFPQGGINQDETPEQAMFRELYEETGLGPDNVTVIGSTQRWLRYNLPRRYIRRRQKPLCIGQKQIWFLLQLRTEEERVNLAATDHPEFDRWRWVEYWSPIRHVIYFKRDVYRRALIELGPLIGRRWRRRSKPRKPNYRTNKSAKSSALGLASAAEGLNRSEVSDEAQNPKREFKSKVTSVADDRPKRRRRYRRLPKPTSIKPKPSSDE